MISLLFPVAVQIALQQAQRTNTQSALQSSYYVQQQRRQNEERRREEQEKRDLRDQGEGKMEAQVTQLPITSDAVNESQYWEPGAKFREVPRVHYFGDCSAFPAKEQQAICRAQKEARLRDDPIRNYTDIPRPVIPQASYPLDRQALPWWKEWWAVALAVFLGALVGAGVLRAIQDNEDFG